MVNKCEKCPVVLVDFIADIDDVVVWVFRILCNQLDPNRLHCVGLTVFDLFSSNYKKKNNNISSVADLTVV